jgi:hypothetical protein
MRHRRGGTPVEQQVGRQCRRDRTQRAQHHHQAVQERYAISWKPENERLQSRGHSRGNTQTYQRPAEQKHPKMVRHREQRRADRRDQQQHALDPPWTKTVEEDTDGYLGSGEGQEIDRRQQAKVVGTEPQFRRQRSCHDRIDRPEQIGDVIAEDEWQEDAQDQRPLFDRILRHLSRCR